MKCRKAYGIMPVGENDRSAHVAQQKAPEVATPGLFYHLAVLDFQTARSEEAQWEARKTMARLEQIAAQEYGFEYADDLHERELGGKRVLRDKDKHDISILESLSK